MIARNQLTSGGTSGTVTDPSTDDDGSDPTFDTTSDFSDDQQSSQQVGGSGDPTDGSDYQDDADASQRVGGSGDTTVTPTDDGVSDDLEYGITDNRDEEWAYSGWENNAEQNGDDWDDGMTEEPTDDTIETGIYGAGRDPGTQTTVDEDGQSDGIDGSEISGDPSDDSDGSTDWGFGPDSAGTKPDINVDVPAPEIQIPDLSSMVSRQTLLVITAAAGSLIIVALVAVLTYIKAILPGV